LPAPLVLLAEAEAVHLLLEQEVGVAHFVDAHPAQHLAHDHFDVLVADGHALQTVDFLDFVHQVSLQFLLAQHGKNVVRVQAGHPSADRRRAAARLPAR
jgi:hypothetical protein